jgi:predicted nucleic acid-binding protein
MMSKMSFLIDSGILMRHLRRDRRASRLLDHLRDLGALKASVVSVFEVYRGVRSEREEGAAHHLFSQVAGQSVDVETARIAAEIARGHRGILLADRAIADALIAGTAMILGDALVTLNTRQFSKLQVPGLDLLLIDQQAADWTTAVP